MPVKEIRPVRIDGPLAYVPLTQGYEAVIDAEDVPRIDGWNWCAHVESNTVYALRSEKIGGQSRTIRLHRVIMSAPEGLGVDHISGDGLDNRKANLRLATTSQNNHNGRMRKNNSSGHKGVSFCKDTQKWLSRICLHGVKKNLGRYDRIEDAAAAYAEASKTFHGSFGRVA